MSQRTQGLGVSSRTGQPAFAELQVRLSHDRVCEKLALFDREFGGARDFHLDIDALDPRIGRRFLERERARIGGRSVRSSRRRQPDGEKYDLGERLPDHGAGLCRFRVPAASGLCGRSSGWAL